MIVDEGFSSFSDFFTQNRGGVPPLHPPLSLFFILLLQGKITNEEKFYTWLGEFLRTSGMSYQKDIRTENGTGNLPFLIMVRVTQFSILHKWIVLFERADWLARRWLAKYYSPPVAFVGILFQIKLLVGPLVDNFKVGFWLPTYSPSQMGKRRELEWHVCNKKRREI